MLHSAPVCDTLGAMTWFPDIEEDGYVYREKIGYVPRIDPDGTLVIDTYINDILREQMELKEEVLVTAAVAALRLKGYTVIEPKE